MLKIPSKYRNLKGKNGHGKYVFCGKVGCKKTISPDSKCGCSTALAKSCPFKGSHVYQSRVWNPLVKKWKTKTWPGVSDFVEYESLDRDFRKELEEHEFSFIESPPNKKEVALLNLHISYKRFLAGETAYVNESKPRSKNYIKDVDYRIKTFFGVLKQNGISLDRLKYDSISGEMVDWYYKEISSRSYSPETFNKYILDIRHFFNFIINEVGHKIQNPFAKTVLQSVSPKKIIFSHNNLDEILSVINPQNGIGQKGKKRVEKINYFKRLPNFEDVIMLHALTGARPGEVVRFKWGHIDGNYLKIPNLKVNRLNQVRSIGVTEEATRLVFITDELAEVLGRFATSMKEDEFVVFPKRNARESLRQEISSAFRHYLSKTQINKPGASIDNLRHTFISNMAKLLSVKGYGDIGLKLLHADERTALQNYYNPEEMMVSIGKERLYSLKNYR